MSKSQFNPSWLEEEDFKVWLTKSPQSNSEARCKLCAKTFSLSSMGRQALKSHMAGKLHIQNVKALSGQRSVASLFYHQNENRATSPTSSASPEISTPSMSSSKNIPPKTSLMAFIENEATTRAEIVWCLHSAKSHVSNRGAAAGAKLFASMFLESEIAKKVTLSKDKIGYTVNHGIAPFFKKRLLDTAKKADFFSVSFDESLNKYVQRGQMDINVRFMVDDNVQSHYFDSVFLGRARAEDLLHAFLSGIAPLDAGKMPQVSLDGPNVNKKLLRLLNDVQKEADLPPLVDMGTCSLHSVCGALKYADNKTFQVGKFLSDCYYVFNDSPSRRAVLLQANDVQSAKFPTKFCSTRWVQNADVAQNMIHVFPLLQRFVEFVNGDKSLEPTSDSYISMKERLKDPLLLPKIAFFCDIARILERFLIKFQTDAPMVPFLRSSLEELFHAIGKTILKEEVLAKAHCVELTPTNLLPRHEVRLSFSVKGALRKSRKNEQLRLNFQETCTTFATTVMLKLREVAPMTKKFIRGTAFLDPDMWKNQEFHGTAEKLMDLALEEMIKLDWLDGLQADCFKEAFLKRMGDQQVKESIACYEDGRLDVFWSGIFDDRASPERKLINRVLVLQHGQASVERGFSVNREAMEFNQLEESLVAQRVIYDAIKDTDLCQIGISKELISYCRNSSRRYKDRLAQQKAAKDDDDAAVRERKRAAQELALKEAEIKKRRMELMVLEEEVIVLRKK